MYPRSFQRSSASFSCAKAASWPTARNPPCSPRSIFADCSGWPSGWARATGISIFTERNQLGCVQSARLRQCVEQFGKGAHGAIHAVDLGVFRFDDLVLVGSVRPASMAESKRARRQMQRVAGENVPGPRPRAARKNDRIDSAPAVHLGFDVDQRRVGARAVGVVTARHANFDVAETFFREVRLERGERLRGGHAWNETQVELRGGLSGENCLSARTGVTANEAFDVHGGPRHQEFQRFVPAYVVNPVLDSKK